MQVVEEEFKQTAANLGVTGAEAEALAHHWASPEATGPHPPAAHLTRPTPFNDSAHGLAHTGQQSGQQTYSALAVAHLCALHIIQVSNNPSVCSCLLVHFFCAVDSPLSSPM